MTISLVPPATMTTPHKNHLPDYDRTEQLKQEMLLKNGAKNSNDKPREMLTKYYMGLSEKAVATSATRGALRQRAHRARHNRNEKVEAF